MVAVQEGVCGIALFRGRCCILGVCLAACSPVSVVVASAVGLLCCSSHPACTLALYCHVLQSDRKKCIRPDCSGILVYIEGPNKYPILNIEEEVKVGADAHCLCAPAGQGSL